MNLDGGTITDNEAGTQQGPGRGGEIMNRNIGTVNGKFNGATVPANPNQGPDTLDPTFENSPDDIYFD